MEETFEEYKSRILNMIHVDSQNEGTTYDDYFLTTKLDELETMGELVDPIPLSVNKNGTHNRLMGFDAYGFDEGDNSVVLISNEFKDSLDSVLTMSEINRIRTKMLNFIDEACNYTLSKYFDKFDDALVLGQDIARRMDVDYVSDDEPSIDKIKLFIITNQDISELVRDIPISEFLGKQVSLNIWGLKRFYELDLSGKEREPVVIKTEKFGLDGIPCIKAQMSGNLDYDAYLAIIPGEFLHRIYYEYGTRLLEGNVRAFLSNRGKINRGIRETIKNEPTKFFTYNNGIACTAADIKFSDDGSKIIELEDLQIINGGQTTASLTSAVLKDKRSLENIFVQMKLTVVKNSDYETMIQNISRFSNSQNKVTDADFFSNHAFHRKFAELASKNPVVLGEGVVSGSYWYYERSRGKYEQEQFRLTTDKQKNDFKRKYPKDQLIKKEQLAKYFVAAELLNPDRVCMGSSKVMNFFGDWVDKKYQKEPEIFNNEFYKRCICYAIIYRGTDVMVSKAAWYNVGGYKLNIVPYTVSKLFSLIPKDYTLDFDRIWRKQTMYPSLAGMIKTIAPITNEFIKDSGGMIVTEYCKRDSTWKKFIGVKIPVSNEFIDDLVSPMLAREKQEAEKKSEKMNLDISMEMQIYNMGAPYWRGLLDEGTKRGLLTPEERSLLSVAASIDKPGARFPTDKQAKVIWKIRQKLGDKGVLI